MRTQKRPLEQDKIRECVMQLHALKTLKRRLVIEMERHQRDVQLLRVSLLECEDQIDAIENDLNNTARFSRERS